MEPMNQNRLRLLTIIIAAFALRLTLLGRQSLWYDEGVTWLLSQMKSLADLVEWTAADIQPPLYYLLIWSTDILFGHSEWALRFPSALFNTLTVPLVYALARRLFGRGSAPRLAALLFAVSPLMVYYSQEARMYSLLVFEAVLTGYLLLNILHPAAAPNRTLRVYPLLYGLGAAAALYTHYFAAFLVAVHLLYTVVVLLGRPRQSARLLPQTAVMFGLAALLFAPWLPTLLSRLGDDPSYWPGALKLNEAIRKVLISYTAGETVLEQTGLWLAAAYLLALALGGLWLALNRRGRIFTRLNLFLLTFWLVLPPALILTLSYRSPKFNPRYAMLSWPAFILLVAAILAGLLERKPRPALSQRASAAFFALGLVAVLATSGFSLYNWFTDPRFSKDDFKALAQFVRERMAKDETVLLSSGHLFPVWAYYYGWQNWTPLPWMQRLDVNRVTGLDIATDIAGAVTGKEGVWLVTWQDEVIDPNGVVPFWLDRIGRRPNDAGDFWGVGLEHWRLNPRRLNLLRQSPISRPAAVNFANRVDLLGMTQLSDTDLALFWRARQPLPANLALTLHLTDPEGFGWDRNTQVALPGSQFYPPSRWPVGQIVMTRHHLAWQTGSPPGLYLAEIGLGEVTPAAGFTGWDILDEQGRPQRRTALLEFVNLSNLVRPANAPLPFDDDPLVNFFPIVAVRRSILPRQQAEPGESLLLALLWQAGKFNFDDISIAFDLVDSAGQTFRVGSSLTPSRRFNLPRWQPGDLVLGQYRLNIPANAAPGPARLKLHLVNLGAFSYDETFPLAALDILPATRNFTPPESVDIPLAADFSGLTTLIGVDCPANCTAPPGATIPLTLYWRADAALDKQYTVFTHLLGPDETVIVNADHAPPKPTLGWTPPEIITDPVTLTLPANLPPGRYAVEIGLYNAADPAFPRLPLTNGSTRLVLPRPLVVK